MSLPFEWKNLLQVRWANEDKSFVVCTHLLNSEDADDPEKTTAHVREFIVEVSPDNDVWNEILSNGMTLEEIDRMTKVQIASEQDEVLALQKQDAEEIHRLAKENVTTEYVEKDAIESIEWILDFDAEDETHSEHLFNLKLNVIERNLTKLKKRKLDQVRGAETPLKVLSIVHSIME